MGQLGEKIARRMAYGLLSYVYGPEVADRVFSSGDVKCGFSGTGALRRIYLNDKLIFTVRVHDGKPLPTIEGAQFINKIVIVRNDAKPFLKKGRNVMAKSVIDIRNAIPGDEVVVYSEDGELLCVGRLMLSLEEAKSIGRGVAVKTRQHT